jgi:ribonuclease HI
MSLPDSASIFTAEAKAIDLALSYIEQHSHDKFVIFSDSLYVLISIKNKKMDNRMIKKLLLRFHDIHKIKSVKLYWIPSHAGKRRNEKVDA